MASMHAVPMAERSFIMSLKGLNDEGTFDGYLSRWNDEDAYGDVIEPGAFKQSLKKKGDTRPLLWQHFEWEPIGVLKAREDDEGLFIQGHINREVERAREAHALAKQGAVTGLSQGFMPVKWAPRKDGGTGRRLQEIDLWEGSLVTFPALDSARVMTVRNRPYIDEAAIDERIQRGIRTAIDERQERERRAASLARSVAAALTRQA